ncbi:hypothetical protein FACS1894205_0760 [Alphaproteobacteria bacterium]|nr:hypothetical protein FACS1894205_0760 [Alphaproteobacteria bacterium]
MNDEPDLDALAGRYLDLCQDQATDFVNDIAVIEKAARSYAAMAEIFGALAEIAGLTARRKATDESVREQRHEQNAEQATGAEPVLSVVDNANLDSDRLRGRIATLEERVLRLESALASKGRSTRLGSGRH